MKPALPAAVAGYFQHDQDNAPARLALCFADDAVVLDERHSYRGRAAIAAWCAEAKQKYAYRTEILDHSGTGTNVDVRVRVSGNFPGSPVQLAYRFALAGAQIESLEIAPCQ